MKNLNAQNLFFEKITGREVNPVTQIHGIAKDSVGYIWIGSWNGAYRYDGKTFDFYYHNPNDKTSLPNNRIRNIFSDKKTGLWFLTFDKKYVKFNYKLNSFKIIDSVHVPKSVIRNLGSTSNALNKNKIIDGKRYFLSSHLFTSHDLISGKEHQYTANINHPGQLLDDYITDFFIDDQNIIWLGTRGGDIYKANPNRNPFELHYSFRKGSDNTKLATVRAVTKYEDKVWLGTDEGILIYKNNELDANNPFYKSGSSIKNVRSLLRDNKGRIWIGGITGLECYDPKTNRCTAVINKVLAPKLETWSIFTLESNGSDYLWTGLYNGIARINLADDSIQYFNLSKEINQHSVMDILYVNDHELWLATEGNGIVRVTIDRKGIVKNAIRLNSFEKNPKYNSSDNIIFALHKDKRGNVWAGSSEGLNKISPSTHPMRIEKIQLFSETPNTYISSITDDNKGNLWISHKQGISMIDIASNKILNYQKEDRFGLWTFSERAFYKDASGQKIYFGDKNGYVAFNPNEIKTVEANNKLVFKSLYLANEKVSPMKLINGQKVLSEDLSQTKEIQLDYDNRSFTIEFASLNYNRTNKEIFEYMFEGYDDKWIKTSSGKVIYNKIPPGSYVFKARIISLNDTKSPIQTLEVNISAPWYDTLLAKGLFLLLIIGSVYWIFKEILYRDRLKNEIKLAKLNTEKQEELNREKLEFFTNISHDLKTPLTLIADPIKQLENKDLSINEKTLYFSIINRNLNYLTRLIQQILDFRKSEIGRLKLNTSTQNFNVFIEECYNTFKYIADKRSINFKLETEKTPLNCYLDFEKTDQILINIISNALKYTPDGGTVLLSAHLNNTGTELEITVQDNGIGIESKELEKIFEPFNNSGPNPFHGYSSGIGLSLTKSLVEFLNGTITIESIVDKGTTVTISLPFNASSETPVIHNKEISVETLEDKSPEDLALQDETYKPTVLVVEDNPDVQAYLNNELSNEYIIIQEYNGKKGLETAIQTIPDLIISDVMMPEMEGTELCKELKMNENTCHIPIILLTAKGSDENQIEGYELGAEAYVMKPFSVEVLKAQIKSVLDNRLILQNKLAHINSISQLQVESPNLDKIFISKTVDLISSHIEETDFTAETLANELKISQRQLYRKIKAVSGCTVHEFITKVRMDHAENLLKNSDLSISQIAYKVGFSEASNFSRTFSKHFGCSPSQYGK
ncbi:hybrid sensor histidine kinase/response regulator transcription factor [Flavobacterium limi]|uniref:hybrid sensor histidine kinase/response regulator transcription factor n=1 Tax=Flavobacterium limi TaxID=2045105 RepID=UPI0013D373A9|nr:hybrid sensor histidine kinase/response regulator transcription factor [Flavobacterium limi]